jgi:hypothetical protein
VIRVASARMFIKELCEQSVEKVARKRPNGFKKSDVMRELRRSEPLDKALKDVHARYNGMWQLGDLLERQINSMIGDALGVRDEYRIRVYECYSVVGQKEHRWLPLRAMTKGMLLNVMRETRVQERKLHVKGEAYEFFMTELDKLDEDATVEQVYEIVAPKIVEFRSRAA